ncbi:hypothetical protein COB87_001620 [Candidatus Wolfebacteria bacterium]|nr:hypothetical protein [Candidatus Wolfebacteria bacterium]
MKIGLDFDGVIANCGKLKSDVAKMLFDLDIPPHKFKREIVIGEGHLTAEQYLNLQMTIYETREYGFLMEPVAGVLECVPKLLALGHTILVVTSRGEAALKIAKEWSAEQGLTIDFVGLGYGVSKAEACRGLDVYIDDDLDKLKPLVGIVPHRYLFSWGYNMHVANGNIAKRMVSWDEFHNTIKSL